MAVRSVARPVPNIRTAERDLSARARSWAYAEAGKRDLRLDFLRGLAVSAMVVDHIGGDTFLTRLSGANQAIVSAAEAFVFLSGLVLGMVYGDRFRMLGPRVASKGLLLRAFTLYKASVAVALAFVALFAFSDLRLWYDRSSGLGIHNPVEAVVGALTLHYSYHGSDVLVMYTIMIAVAPAIIYQLYKGRTLPVLLASLAIWTASQHFPEVAALPWTVLDSSFPVSAWQLLMVLGSVVGFHRAQVSRSLLSSGPTSKLAIFVAGSMVYLLAWSHQRFASSPIPWLADTTYGFLFLKESLGRVLAFLSLAVLLYTLVHALWSPLHHALGWFMIPMGQNSLYVYIAQLLVMVVLFNTTPAVLMWGRGYIDLDLLSLGSQLFGLGSLWLMVRSRFLFALIPR